MPGQKFSNGSVKPTTGMTGGFGLFGSDHDHDQQSKRIATNASDMREEQSNNAK
jgi:hypothetical protein